LNFVAILGNPSRPRNGEGTKPGRQVIRPGWRRRRRRYDLVVNSSTVATAPEPSRPVWGIASFPQANPLLASIVIWTAVCLVQTLAGYSDALAAGRQPSFSGILGETIPLYLPWAAFTAVLFPVLAGMRYQLDRPAVFLIALALASVAFLLPYECYLVALRMHAEGIPWTEFMANLRRHPAMFVFVDYILFLGGFSFVYAVALFQRTLRDERARRRMEAENLSLRLQVEQGRLAALQAQLEPHFLFNCLNALSALVRQDQHAAALSAIQRLGDLLRYATAANGRESVTIGEEVDFVEGYVALQRLRYGERLDFSMEIDPSLRAVECPALIIQPLVENAIRHGLEHAAGSSRIRLLLAQQANSVEVAVVNALPPDFVANGGLGIGLTNIRDRLAMVYGERARLATGSDANSFTASLSFPVDWPG
jgi:hypothetical protein